MKINFVCWGNICRSPMAEYIFKSLDVDNRFNVISSAISNEEYGNDIYPPAKEVLDKYNINYNLHRAHKITKEEFDNSDLIIVMEDYHIDKLTSMFNSSDKIIKLLEKDIEDPWYTGEFDKVFHEIYEGCKNIYNKLTKEP